MPDQPFYLTEYNVGCCIGYQGHDTRCVGKRPSSFYLFAQFRHGKQRPICQDRLWTKTTKDSNSGRFLTVFDRFSTVFDRFLWHSASAAFAFRTIPHLDGVVDILSWWTFTDVFEEGGAKESPFLRYLYIKPIILPRQARDKYRESTQTEWRVAQACRPRSTRISVSWLLKARLTTCVAVCCLLAAGCCVLPAAYCY